jgi:glutamate-1-semialdehyde 2,1-aminomutase
VAVAAGLAVLDLLEKEGVYERLSETAGRLAGGLRELATSANIPFSAEAVGGLVGFRFHPGPIRNYSDATEVDQERFKGFFHAMLDSGIYLAPSPFEVAFVTTAHEQADLDETLEVAERALRKVG